MSELIHWCPHVEKLHRGPPYLTPAPAACGKTMPMNYVEFPQFKEHVTCPVCLICEVQPRPRGHSQSDGEANG